MPSAIGSRPCVQNFQQMALRHCTPTDSGTRLGIRVPPGTVFACTVFGIRSSATEPAAGGAVDQSGTWVRDRFLAAREASRTVFDRPANAREIPAAATALGSRHAIAVSGSRY